MAEKRTHRIVIGPIPSFAQGQEAERQRKLRQYHIDMLIEEAKDG